MTDLLIRVSGVNFYDDLEGRINRKTTRIKFASHMLEKLFKK